MSNIRQHPTITHLNISSSGTVVNTKTGRELKGSTGVIFTRHPDGTTGRFPVKRLVWEAHVGSVEDGKAVYNKDFDPLNFALDNLMCLTEEEFRAFNVKCLEEQGWRAHPKHNWYVADSEGTVMHAVNRNVLEGHPQDGYVILDLCMKRSIVHIIKQAFIVECFVGLYNRKTHEANHINGIRDDNSWSNLELLTKEEHWKKTKNFPSQTRAIANQRPVICISTGVKYISVTEAARSVVPENVKQGVKNLCNVLGGQRKTYLSLRWRYEQDEDLGGEVWKQITTDHMFDSIDVSSRGRIKLKTGKIVEGAMLGETRVTVTNSNGLSKQYQVHYIVCRAFHGDPPGDWETGRISVNHRNTFHDDNNSDNLEWSTPQLQAEGKKNMKVTLGKYVDNEEWLEFPTMTAAGKYFNVSNQLVSKVCNGETAMPDGVELKFKERPIEHY